jgi:hypothetical protein
MTCSSEILFISYDNCYICESLSFCLAILDFKCQIGWIMILNICLAHTTVVWFLVISRPVVFSKHEYKALKRLLEQNCIVCKYNRHVLIILNRIICIKKMTSTHQNSYTHVLVIIHVLKTRLGGWWPDGSVVKNSKNITILPESKPLLD